MGEKIKIPDSGDLEQGKMKGVTIQGKELVLARVGEEYYAVDGVCPHMKGRLSEGTLEGYTVTCPRHGSQFDVRNGENIRWLKGSGPVSGLAKIVKPPQSLNSYKVETGDDGLYIEL